MKTKIIQIDDSLRLVPYFLADHRDAALAWYQDVDLVELVDGIRIPYSLEKIKCHVFLFREARRFVLD